MSTQTEILNSIPIDELTGALSVPIYQTSTFLQEKPGVNKGFDYSRSNNPTRKALEDIAAKLENGDKGFAFSSGLAAIDSVIKLFESGDEIIAVDDIYGGTYRLLTHIYQKFGINIKYVDTSNLGDIVDAVSDKTKCIWIETPTNPTLKISDINSISKIAKANNSLLVVDNTFATPVSQKPLDLGADIVVHSATKYIGGHSDVIAGLVITKNDSLSEKIKFIQNSSGAVLGPQDCWLTIRGIETLPLRFKQHSLNAQKLTESLLSLEEVDKVFYPGLESHKNYDIACKQQKYFGGIVSFTLKNDSFELASKFVSSTKLFKLAESLGGVKSLICHPAQMTHKSTPKEVRLNAGINDSLIRLSVGLEEVEDLIDDIESTYENINKEKIKI